jgi:DNA modification methylase
MRKPSGWNAGPTSLDKIGRYPHAPDVNPKAAQNNPGSKQNASFSAGVKDIVEFRNKRSVWTFSTCPTPEAHFATFTIELAETCILAGCPEGGVILDPFSGAATTGLAALKHGRRYLGIELNPAYIDISYTRARKYYPLLVGEEVTA